MKWHDISGRICTVLHCALENSVATGGLAGVANGVARRVAMGVDAGVKTGVATGVARRVENSVATGVLTGVWKGAQEGQRPMGGTAWCTETWTMMVTDIHVVEVRRT